MCYENTDNLHTKHLKLLEWFQCDLMSRSVMIVMFSPSGQYICNATNAVGFSEAYVQMEVDCEWHKHLLSLSTCCQTHINI